MTLEVTVSCLPRRFVIASRPQREASVLTLANDPISLCDLFCKREAPEATQVKDRGSTQHRQMIEK